MSWLTLPVENRTSPNTSLLRITSFIRCKFPVLRGAEFSFPIFPLLESRVLTKFA
jgi:hypothetical protein